jgi:hypothetical protein
MTVENGAHGAEDERDRAVSPSNGRDDRGRFGRGNQLGRGRPKSSITRELKRQGDPAAIARYLLDLAEGRLEANHRERLEAAKLVTERTEGKPLARSISMRINALPAGFDHMTPEQRADLLDRDDELMLGDGADHE